MTSPETVKTYSDNLNKLLARHDMAQRKFADMSGINYKSLVNYCTAKCLPNIDIMLFISKYFKVSIEQMFSKDLKIEEIPDTISVKYGMLNDEEKAAISKYIDLMISAK